MADLADVEQAIVSTITQAIYPYGTAAACIAGQPCRVYRGWPSRHNLDSDLRDDMANISVFPMPAEQNLSRYNSDWQPLPKPPVKLTMAVSGKTVTIGGTPTCPLNAAVKVDGNAFVYPLQATDTPTTIATALAALINAVTPATNTGPVITIPAAINLTTVIGVVGSIIQEVKRQKKSFRITVWCNSPQVRDTIANIIDPQLAKMSFISLPDGSSGRIRYEKTAPDDMTQKALLYRRDLVYSVEYATTITQRAAGIVAETFNITGGLDPNAPAIETFTI